VARMKSPAGWIEPGQRPEFTEYTVVLRGMLRVATQDQVVDVRAGESAVVEKVETSLCPLGGIRLTLRSPRQIKGFR
jgi:hypothetical protein